MRAANRSPVVRFYAAVSAVLLPDAFRRAHGGALVDLFADLYHEAWSGGGWRAARVTGREIMGLFRTARSERKQKRGRLLPTILDDVRAALRSIRRDPALSLAVILILALGIGANTAIFSVLNAVLLRPLSYPESDRLMQVLEFQDDRPAPRVTHSLELYQQIKDEIEGVEVGAYSARMETLTGADEPLRVEGWAVSPSTMSLLRVAPLLGRTFEREEEQPGNEGVLLLSHSLWQQHFGGDPATVGRTVQLDGAEHRIIGVMPAGFRFLGYPADLWVPLVLSAPRRQGGRPLRSVPLLARLADGVRAEQVEDEINAILEGLRREGPPTIRMIHGGTVGLVPLKERLIAGFRTEIWMLQGAVALVLLIGCSNVANLLLARASTRRKEIAMRTALGCGRARLVGQLLTESLVLALLAGAGGSLLAIWGTRALVGLGPAEVPRLDEVGLDARMLAFAVLTALATGLAFGLVPALRSSRFELREALNAAGVSGKGARQRRVGGALVISQVALALMLAVGAGLLVSSLVRLMQVDPGYEPEHVATLQIDLPPVRYGRAELHAAFYDQLLERVSRLPGVQTAGVANLLPLFPASMGGGFLIDGEPEPASNEEVPTAAIRLVSPQYFNTLGIPLLRGRGLGGDVARDKLPAVVVNESLAATYFEDGDPIGRYLQLGEEDDLFEIVGVVGDVRHSGLSGEPMPTLYASHHRMPEFFESKGFLAGIFLVVRTTGDPMTAIPQIRSAVRALDPGLPVFDVFSMEQRVWDSVARTRFYATLLGLFSFAALVLVSVGIYGVIAHFVGQRVAEIGVRVALGAAPRDILRLVIGQGLLLTLGGIAVGIAGAVAVTRFLSSLLFAVTPTDPLTFAAVALLLLVVSILALYRPTRRAMAIDPMIALRRE